MVTLVNTRTKQKVTKSRHEADVILGNKVTGSDWKVVSETTEVAAPLESVKKVSISEKAPEAKSEKPTKKNNAN
jgi:hypothetical protein